MPTNRLALLPSRAGGPEGYPPGMARVGDLEDPRRGEPSPLLPERETLEGFLEFHRVTLLLKCEGLDDEQRKRRPVATSKLSLHGLVRHMAEVERGWFQRVLCRNADANRRWEPVEAERELVPLADADWEADLAEWHAECEASRTSAARYGLDDLGTHAVYGEISLRWIYVHMLEEYARHNGHADLIREIIDGAVGG